MATAEGIQGLHEEVVQAFAALGAAAVRAGGCPLEAMVYVMAEQVASRAGLMEMTNPDLTQDVAAGIGIGLLIAGRPGSWEAAEVVRLVRIPVPEPAVSTQEAEKAAYEWTRSGLDGGRLVAEAMAEVRRRAGRMLVVPDGSALADSKFGP